MEAITQEDDIKLLFFCNAILQLLENVHIEIHNILFKDECHEKVFLLEMPSTSLSSNDE